MVFTGLDEPQIEPALDFLPPPVPLEQVFSPGQVAAFQASHQPEKLVHDPQ